MKLLLTAVALAAGALVVPAAQLALAQIDDLAAKPAMQNVKPASRAG